MSTPTHPMRMELTLCLACIAVAIAIGHVAFTCRDRGGITAFTLLVGAFKGLAFLRRLALTEGR